MNASMTGAPQTPRLAVPCAQSAFVMTCLREVIAGGLARPVAIGPTAAIAQAALDHDVPLDALDILPADGEHDAVRQATDLARDGAVAAIMKGHVHTDVLLSAVLAPEAGLRTGSRLSHIYHVTGIGRRPLIITDSGVNIAPDAPTKLAILSNAVAFAHDIGIPRPRVAILSATEEPTPRMPSSMEARAVMEAARSAGLACIAFGPIALDCALSHEAAAAKQLENEVAGEADILLVPNIETGNALSKLMVHAMGAVAAGLVLGARVPLIVPSRADPPSARLEAVRIAIARTPRAAGAA